MKQLIGSQKQIVWANEIRTKLLEYVELCWKNDLVLQEKDEELKEENTLRFQEYNWLKELINDCENASFIIDKLKQYQHFNEKNYHVASEFTAILRIILSYYYDYKATAVYREKLKDYLLSY